MKELISEILNENDEKKAVLMKEKNSLEAGTLYRREMSTDCSIVRIRAGS